MAHAADGELQIVTARVHLTEIESAWECSQAKGRIIIVPQSMLLFIFAGLLFGNGNFLLASSNWHSHAGGGTILKSLIG